jgi:hypothetical protein
MVRTDFISKGDQHETSETRSTPHLGHITPDMGQFACVSAFTADAQAGDTNGSGAGQSGLDTILDKDTPHPDTFGQGGGPWGVWAATR